MVPVICQPQPILRTFAAGSLYLQMLTVFSAYSAVEIEDCLQANVSVIIKKAVDRSNCAVTSCDNIAGVLKI